MAGDGVGDDVAARLGLDGPEADDLSYTGPGDEVDAPADPYRFDRRLPGQVDPDVAAYASGGLGAFLMGVTGMLRRRRYRREAGPDR